MLGFRDPCGKPPQQGEELLTRKASARFPAAQPGRGSRGQPASPPLLPTANSTSLQRQPLPPQANPRRHSHGLQTPNRGPPSSSSAGGQRGRSEPGAGGLLSLCIGNAQRRLAHAGSAGTNSGFQNAFQSSSFSPRSRAGFRNTLQSFLPWHASPEYSGQRDRCYRKEKNPFRYIIKENLIPLQG